MSNKEAVETLTLFCIRGGGVIDIKVMDAIRLAIRSLETNCPYCDTKYEKVGHCEDCDYFKPKFDEFTTVWGPVRKWSRYECIRLNAKTEKNGYCHMFEKRKEVEE